MMIANSDLVIETERLKILPLNISQLEKYMRNDNSLEEELKLNKTIRHISDELKEAMALAIIPSILDKPEDYLFSTLWIVVNKEENRMVAGITLMAISGTNGDIEIGYGTGNEYQNKGYMTEAIGGIINWVKGKPGLKKIIASTEKSNKASHNVLIKNNFNKFHESNTMICWKFDLNK
jgi:[ribosomal protein S5]-alanine N-acetyltransferase